VSKVWRLCKRWSK